jgi:type I restriction enzyme S subunit
MYKQIRGMGQAGTQSNLNGRIIKSIPLMLPPIREQQGVVLMLAAWDLAIDLTERLIEAKQRRKQCLMQQLLTGSIRFPGFGPPARRHGELPEGWKCFTLKQITQRITRTTSRRDLPVLSITAGTGFVDQQDKFSKIIAGRNIEKYTHIRKGEFSYNKGNSKTYPQGCVYRLTDNDEGVVPNVYFSFAVKEDQALPVFMSLLFESGALNQQLTQHINTGVRNDGLLNLNASGFFSVEVNLPGKEEQQAISSALMSADAEIRSLIKYCAKLRQQKRGLMQQLLTGRLRVKLDTREDGDAGAGD